jgi:hypothetical protein
MEYLLNSPDDRAGALGFGLNVRPPAPVRNFNRTLDLAKLIELEHDPAEQNRKVPSRIKGFPRVRLWVSLLALILSWRLSDAELVFCRDA